MNDSEFDVIKKYFSFTSARDDVVIASGDDCAAVTVPSGKKLLITTDTLISGVHFPGGASPEDIAYKSLMVNLSDLAAMGATPAWVTLAITLPDINETWLAAFSKQFLSVLTAFNISLIGGDTTKGTLSITVQAMGLCDQDKMMCRDKAVPGDKVFVTGFLGDAAVGLKAVVGELNDEKLSVCVEKLNRPVARVSFAEELTQYVRCAIDLSDGLAADFGHVLDASDCGARIQLSEIPLSSATQYYFTTYNKSVTDWSMVLAHGDDYELCFTVNDNNKSEVEALASKHRLKLCCIGVVTQDKQLEFITTDNEVVKLLDTGFKHF